MYDISGVINDRGSKCRCQCVNAKKEGRIEERREKGKETIRVFRIIAHVDSVFILDFNCSFFKTFIPVSINVD